MAHFNIDLDLDKSQAVGQVVRARVGDVESCVIAATIYDHGSEVDLAGKGARFCMVKPDRTVIEDDDCEVSGSTVTHTLGTQATAAAGVAELAYFEILDGSTVIDSTQSFRLVVEPDVEGSGSGPSEDYISRVDAATEAANDAAEAASSAAQTANAAAEAASAAAEAARGNVLKGTLGPDAIVSADDAYATKPRGLTVYGSTRQNLWVNPSGTNSGITATANDDGSLTVAGTATAEAYIRSSTFALRDGATYTVSIDKSPVGFSLVAQYYNADGFVGGAFSLTPSGATEVTFTADFGEATHVFLLVNVKQGATASGTYCIMLNEGSEAEPWCPPGLSSVDELSVVCAGRNLLTSAFGGIDYSARGGVAYGQADMACPVALSGKDVTVSVYVDGEDVTVKTGWALYIGFVTSATTNSLLTLFPSIRSGTVGDVPPGAKLRFYANEDFWPSDCEISVQLELGTTATDYEPPQVTTTPIDLDGHSLHSLPDGTSDELTVDTDGSVMLTKRVGSYTIDGSENWSFRNNKIGATILKDAPENITVNYNAFCDTLPVRSIVSNPVAIMLYETKWVDIRINSVITDEQTGKTWLSKNHTTTLYPLATPETIALPSVALPALTAPTCNVYADAKTSGTGYAMGPDVEMEYERDVNIAYEQLEAKISALTVAQATS